MEAAIQGAVAPRVRGAPPPGAAHGSEAEIIGNVVGEGELGPSLRWAGVPRSVARAAFVSQDAAGFVVMIRLPARARISPFYLATFELVRPSRMRHILFMPLPVLSSE